MTRRRWIALLLAVSACGPVDDGLPEVERAAGSLTGSEGSREPLAADEAWVSFRIEGFVKSMGIT